MKLQNLLHALSGMLWRMQPSSLMGQKLRMPVKGNQSFKKQSNSFINKFDQQANLQLLDECNMLLAMHQSPPNRALQCRDHHCHQKCWAEIPQHDPQGWCHPSADRVAEQRSLFWFYLIKHSDGMLKTKKADSPRACLSSWTRVSRASVPNLEDFSAFLISVLTATTKHSMQQA